MQGEGFWRVSSFASLFEKNGFVLVDQTWHSRNFYQYAMVQKTAFRALIDFKENLCETPIQGQSFCRV